MPLSPKTITKFAIYTTTKLDAHTGRHSNLLFESMDWPPGLGPTQVSLQSVEEFMGSSEADPLSQNPTDVQLSIAEGLATCPHTGLWLLSEAPAPKKTRLPILGPTGRGPNAVDASSVHGAAARKLPQSEFDKMADVIRAQRREKKRLEAEVKLWRAQKADVLATGAKFRVPKPKPQPGYELDDTSHPELNPPDMDRQQRRKYPLVHASWLIDETGAATDPEVFKALIKRRPEKILKKNAKLAKSATKYQMFYNISLPAVMGLIVDESTDEFIIVNTCPSAGECKLYCYAMKGGYIQYKNVFMSQARTLNYLMNDWTGFKNQLVSEIERAVAAEQPPPPPKSKSKKKKAALPKVEIEDDFDPAIGGTVDDVHSDVGGRQVVVRWHDAGDFFSEKYLELAFDIARSMPHVLFYAYTKTVKRVSEHGSVPENFVFNFSEDSKKEDKELFDPKTHKGSFTVPLEIFRDLTHKEKTPNIGKDGVQKVDKKTGRPQWITKTAANSPEDLLILKTRIADKYGLDVETLLSYDEMIETPLGSKGQYNVIVMPGDGDVSASRSDVLGTYLLFH